MITNGKDGKDDGKTTGWAIAIGAIVVFVICLALTRNLFENTESTAVKILWTLFIVGVGYMSLKEMIG